MKVSRLGSALIAFAMTSASGCATWERKSDQLPAGAIHLAELRRGEYRVGERVSANATVRVQRDFLQKLIPILFGKEVVSGDETITPGFGTVTENTTRGVRGISMSSSSSMQLGDLITSLLGQLGLGSGGGSTAIAQATAAAYFRALDKAPGADFLLEPRVEVTTKGSSSIFFFIPDDETATVTVSGKPITVFPDSRSPAPTAPAKETAGG